MSWWPSDGPELLFDPATGGQTTAVSRFFGVTVSWVFIVTGGHLLVIAGVMQSFQSFPVGPEPFAFLKAVQPHRWGAEVFAIGLWIALPLVAMLLFVNLVMGIASRVAHGSICSRSALRSRSLGLGAFWTLPMMRCRSMALEKMSSIR
jgi:flagellar biosynthetic protein FliR